MVEAASAGGSIATRRARDRRRPSDTAELRARATREALFCAMLGPVRRVPAYIGAPKGDAPPKEGVVSAQISETAVLLVDESQPNMGHDIYYVLNISVLYAKSDGKFLNFFAGVKTFSL